MGYFAQDIEEKAFVSSLELEQWRLNKNAPRLCPDELISLFRTPRFNGF